MDEQSQARRTAAPHVLYVAWGFPPCRGGGVYRALATANAMAAAGLRVTVLTADRETFLRFTGADESLEAQIDPSIRVLRVPFDWPALEWDLRRWPRARVLAPSLWMKRRLRADKAIFPEPGYGAWRPRLEAAAERLHREDPVDVVVATANPAVDYAPALLLHRQHGVPIVLDQRDGWTLDVFSGDRLHSPGSEVGTLEAELVTAASDLWFVNEPIREWYARAYPAAADRMRVVMNGWDDDIAPTVDDPARGPDEPVRFAYVGTVSGKVPLPEFLAGWSTALHDMAFGPAKATIYGYLGFYHTANQVLASALEAAQGEGVSYGGPVAKAAVHEVYEHADVLLLILGAGRFVTSGKVFEYMASGHPIVSVHDPMNACASLLRDYPGWFPAASLAPGDIAAALAAAAAAARTDTLEQRAARRAYAARFRRDQQLAPAVDAVLRAAGAPAVAR
jgi:glycosyltransferase involved in cell wall biosynthesis